MITEDQIFSIREAWIKAAEVFDFEILTPITLTINGVDKEIFAYLDGYGSENGTIIQLIGPPDYQDEDTVISKWSKENKYFCSLINVEVYQTFDKKLFNETLKDWGKFPKKRNY
jgi:hypothetical protein